MGDSQNGRMHGICLAIGSHRPNDAAGAWSLCNAAASLTPGAVRSAERRGKSPAGVLAATAGLRAHHAVLVHLGVLGARHAAALAGDGASVQDNGPS